VVVPEPARSEHPAAAPWSGCAHQTLPQGLQVDDDGERGLTCRQ
jgi:hypothetical protein